MPPQKRKQPSSQATFAGAIDPGMMKVADLKEELENRGLDSTGKKSDLVARLEDALISTPSPLKKVKMGISSEVAEYTKMKIAELKAELIKRGLDTSGKKADLVSKLENDDKVSTSTSTKTECAQLPEKDTAPLESVVDETDFCKAMKALKSAQSSKKKSSKRKVDSFVPGGFEVFEDWDCMLNQTNIGQNNNKFYVIQLLRTVTSDMFYVWTRWGRVGESGQNALKGPLILDQSKKEFSKKFTDKTKNKWENRDQFSPVHGKYTLLEMDDDSGDEGEVTNKHAAIDEPDSAPPVKVKHCSLDKPTQALIKLIFDNDMFNDALKSMEIDTKKMPLGKLSKVQISKGFEVLEQIEAGLNAKVPRSKLAELTSKFYTIIPHDFGRTTPPVIENHETLQKKFDMLLVLGDIEIAQGLKKNKEDKQKTTVGETPHPLDVNYGLLKAKLDHVSSDDREFMVLEKYMKSTKPQWRNLQILDIWKVDREGEHDRFLAHDSIKNRRLLWHGTNVAVVAAILKSGLRIMPHSGGRVGKGIYFASECSKSAGYVRCASDNTGIMFLNEVALGMEHHITMDDGTLTKPPNGFDSVIAKGHTEPDSKLDTNIVLQGKTVTVPQGKPITVPEFSHSGFSQSEYLVYKENQARMRYLLKLKF